MGDHFILFPIFYFSGTFKHCPGHRDRHVIFGTIPVNPGRITCMVKGQGHRQFLWVLFFIPFSNATFFGVFVTFLSLMLP